VTGPLVLSPIHIAFLEMLIDPVCSVVFEAEKEEKDVMRRPRAVTSHLFSLPWKLALFMEICPVTFADSRYTSWKLALYWSSDR
jgi:hypothetical protein